MTDKTHQLIGLTLATSGTLVTYSNMSITWPIVATVIVGSAIGSIAPDIDQPTAGLWHKIPAGHAAGKLTSFMLRGHRHISHSLVGFGLFYGLATLVGNSNVITDLHINGPILILALAIGFAAHLLADSLTVEGIPLFWPIETYIGFPPRPFQSMRIVTGKWFENLIVLPAVTLLLVALILNYFDRFCGLIFNLCRLG